MLSPKPWKTSAVLRLVFSALLCLLGGSLIMAALHFHGATLSARVQFYVPLLAALACVAGAIVLLWLPWRLDRTLRRLAALLVCVYGGLFLGMWVERLTGPPTPSVAQMLIGLLTFQGLGLLLVWRFLRYHGMTWSDGFGLTNGWYRAVGLGLLAGCLFLPIGRTLQFSSFKMVEWLGGRFPRLGLKPEQQEAVQALETAVSWTSRAALGFLTIVLVPIAEEVLFRGILYPWVKGAGFRRLAWWGTALLFAAMHTNLITFVPLTVFALLLAALYERTNNLLAPISAHAVFNALNFTWLYSLQNASLHP